jgi:hypothetical protein
LVLANAISFDSTDNPSLRDGKYRVKLCGQLFCSRVLGVWGMLDAVSWAITWGLLSIFIVFFVFGAAVAIFAFVRFYWAEIARWQRSSRATPKSTKKATAAAE